jgi:hypothetical protein
VVLETGLGYLTLKITSTAATKTISKLSSFHVAKEPEECNPEIFNNVE